MWLVSEIVQLGALSLGDRQVGEAAPIMATTSAKLKEASAYDMGAGFLHARRPDQNLFIASFIFIVFLLSGLG